jgi:hypothetical protein
MNGQRGLEAISKSHTLASARALLSPEREQIFRTKLDRGLGQTRICERRASPVRKASLNKASCPNVHR